MTSHHFLSWAATAAFLLAPMAAAGQHHGSAPRTVDRRSHSGDHAAPTATSGTAAGKKADIELTQATRVAGTLLAPGHYRVQMQREGDGHVLVIALRETVRRGASDYGSGSGREVLRVSCAVTDGDKNSETTVRARTETDGISVLSSVSIKGEHGAHVVAPPTRPDPRTERSVGFTASHSRNCGPAAAVLA